MSARAASGRHARLVAEMGHDLRTPLNSILGFAELLRRGPRDAATQTQFAGEIVNSARQLLQMINDLVDLARAEAGLLDLVLQPVVLSDLAGKALHEIRPEADRRGIEVSADLARAPPCVVLDAIRISQALRGLLTGAIGLARERQRIALTILADGADRVRFELSGLEVGPDELLEPGPGPRLGIALARYLLEAHGGEVGASRAAGDGTVLHATVPLVTCRK